MADFEYPFEHKCDIILTWLIEKIVYEFLLISICLQIISIFFLFLNEFPFAIWICKHFTWKMSFLHDWAEKILLYTATKQSPFI